MFCQLLQWIQLKLTATMATCTGAGGRLLSLQHDDWILSGNPQIVVEMLDTPDIMRRHVFQLSLT